MKDKDNDKLDHVLEQALSEYRDAEPLAGMEDRILRASPRNPSRTPGGGCGPLLRLEAWL